MLKIHLGCGDRIYKDWKNIDLISHPKIIRHDLTKPLPYENNSVDFIYSEHFLEHLDEVDGLNLLTDCYNKLKVGGVLRLSIPCLSNMIEIYNNWEKKHEYHPYIKNFENPVQFINWAFFGESSSNSKIKFLNGSVSTNDGHKFLYTKLDLFKKLKKVGFLNIEEKQKNESKYVDLQNLETREQICDLTLEAIK